MGTENDIESFIQLQKQKLAQERAGLRQKPDYDQENRQQRIFDVNSTGATDRNQQFPTSKMDINHNQPTSSNTLPFGDHDQKRRQLGEERKREYNERNQGQTSKQSRQQYENTNGDGGIFSKLGQYESKRKVLDVERKNEYNKQVTEAELRRTGRQSSFTGNAIPGLRDHPSANQVKMKQRNAEYNEFLQMQEQKRSNRFADKKGHAVEPYPQQQVSRGQPHSQSPRREAGPGQGTQGRDNNRNNPSYEDILDQKRRQEQSYRRRNDPEAIPTDSRRTYPQSGAFQSNDNRFDDLDRQYERRKVKFSSDRGLSDDTTDVYDWEQSKQGRSRSFYQDPEPKGYDSYERSRSVPPQQEEMTGLAIGHSETASAARRRKDQYRQELQQQMTASNRHRNDDPGGFTRENNFLSHSSQPLPNQYQPPKPLFSDQSASILDDRRPLASILNERRDLVDTSPRGNAVRSGLGPGVLQSGFTGLYEPSILSQSRQPPLQNQGYSQQPYNDAAQSYHTPADPVYNYYGTHEPLASFTAPPLGAPQYPSNTQPQHTFTQPRQTKPFNTPTAAVGAFPSERTDTNRQKKDNQQSYQNELKRQMEEKHRMVAAKKAEQEAYDRKMNEEIANYNPFGRGGAGAPVKDTSGNVVADLRTMNLSNTGQTPRLDTQVAPSQTQPSVDAARFTSTLPDVALNLSAGADTLDGIGHARGGHGIFGEPKTDVQKTAADKYKEDLKKQIEEKKRVADLEKQKLKEEEDREIKRLEEDRIKIQKEFEAEQAKNKAKEEETRRKNAEMKQAAEEKKQQADRENEEAAEKRRQKDEEARQRQLKEREEETSLKAHNKVEARTESPPIPTLRSKTQPPGSLDIREPSPPLPTQRSKTQHDTESLNNSRPVVRDVEPPTNQTADRRPSTPLQNRVDSRAQSAEVLNQLAHMRQQLQQERQRVENALTKQKLDVDVYDPRSKYTGDDTNGIDVFEIARSKKPVSASRRNKTESDDGHSQPSKPLAKPTTATSLLHSDSAFIDDSGMRAAFPDDFDTLATNQNARRRRREKLKPSEDLEFAHLMRQYIGTPDTPEAMLQHYRQHNNSKEPRKIRDTDSVHSIDPDRITRRNQDRLKKLKAIAGDDISLADPDDIIDRFMTKQSHNRPPSGQTLTDDSWINSHR